MDAIKNINAYLSKGDSLTTTVTNHTLIDNAYTDQYNHQTILGPPNSTNPYNLPPGFKWGDGSINTALNHSVTNHYHLFGDLLEGRVFPFAFQTVASSPVSPGIYSIAPRKWGELPPDPKKVPYMPHVVQIMDPIHKITDHQGVEVNQLLFACIDLLERNTSSEREEAIKHLKYAAAYLDKEALEHSK